MVNDPWFPKKYSLTKTITLNKVLFSGGKWQIYSTVDKQRILIAKYDLVNEWVKTNIITKDHLKSFVFGNISYSYILSSERYILQPIESTKHLRDVSRTDGISFVTALKETRRILPNISLEGGIFVEKFNRILPTFETIAVADDSLLLGTYLSGGVPIVATATRRIAVLSGKMNEDDVQEIVEKAVIKEQLLTQSKPKENKNLILKQKKFSLVGAKYLEDFFIENVVDIVQHEERYKKLGIGFPLPLILYGEPGTGKTYAVEKLSEFLDWPLYFINSSTIGSTYIHGTGKKITEIFKKAFETSPSIIIIDEMDAFLSSRENVYDGKVEEVDEFLRLIPKAVENRVLVIGTTNMLHSLDPAVLRTGRFDRKIEVKMPEAEDIEAMIKAQMKSLPKRKNLDYSDLIKKLVGRPRSDVTFIIKEAARLTAFRGKDQISQDEINLAADKLFTTNETKKHKIGF